MCPPLSVDILPSNQINPQRDKAWPQGEYPCVGQWQFLLPSISTFPAYNDLVICARGGLTVLDLGCFFGQNLRLFAAEGMSTEQFFATDKTDVAWKLGYDLFRDDPEGKTSKNKMDAVFIKGDFLDRESELQLLNGRVDIIIACQFLHLFTAEQQIITARRIVELSVPGTIVIGYQRGETEAQEVETAWGTMYHHSPESFREMWGQVGKETGTKWKVEIDLVDVTEWGLKEEDTEWMPKDQRKGINFTLTRQK